MLWPEARATDDNRADQQYTSSSSATRSTPPQSSPSHNTRRRRQLRAETGSPVVSAMDSGGSSDAYPAAPEESRKRRLAPDSPGLVLLEDTKFETIRRVIEDDATKNISLFVWHVGFSGGNNSLFRILFDLRYNNLLHDKVRVLLFAGTYSAYGASSDRPNDTIQDMKEAKHSVEMALKVSTCLYITHEICISES